MKLVSVFTILFSMHSFAFINDFECELTSDNGSDVLIEVERSFGPTKRVNLTIEGNEDETFTYFSQARIYRGMNQLIFTGAGMRLEIDMWPDQRPRYGMSYRSRFNSFDLDNGDYKYNFYCRYLGIN